MAAADKKHDDDINRVRTLWRGGERRNAAVAAAKLPEKARDQIVAEFPEITNLMNRKG